MYPLHPRAAIENALVTPRNDKKINIQVIVFQTTKTFNAL
jgi:hypothetical protein